MSSRKSPSGPVANLTGIIAIAQTTIGAGTIGSLVTATGFAQILVSPAGTAQALMNARVMSTNDVVTASPRGTVPLSTTGAGSGAVFFSFARVLSVGTASAIIEFTFGNTGTTAATAVANTWNINVALAGADL